MGISVGGCYKGLTGLGLMWGDLGEGSGSRALLWIGYCHETETILWLGIWIILVWKAGGMNWGKEAESCLLAWMEAVGYFHVLDNVHVFVWVHTWLWRGLGFVLMHQGHRVALSEWNNNLCSMGKHHGLAVRSVLGCQGPAYLSHALLNV